MKKLILAAVITWFTVYSAYAMGGIMKPKPVIQDVLTADNATWSGLKYQGVPVKKGSDAIGHNVNYIYQVTTITNANGTMRFQVYLRAFAPSAYTVAVNELNKNNPALGYTTYTFQDSGIVIPLANYVNLMSSPTTIDWSWNLILSYDIPAQDVTAFKVAMSAWIVGKLPQKATSGNTSYYWK